MIEDTEINREIKTMNRLISWCLSEKFYPERIKQLITDWSKVSKDIIPEKILMDSLKKMEITFQRRIKDGRIKNL